jgi:hypothetical protein
VEGELLLLMTLVGSLPPLSMSMRLPMRLCVDAIECVTASNLMRESTTARTRALHG